MFWYIAEFILLCCTWKHTIRRGTNFDSQESVKRKWFIWRILMQLSVFRRQTGASEELWTSKGALWGSAIKPSCNCNAARVLLLCIRTTRQQHGTRQSHQTRPGLPCRDLRPYFFRELAQWRRAVLWTSGARNNTRHRWVWAVRFSGQITENYRMIARRCSTECKLWSEVPGRTTWK